jgi:hypothetical protein
MLNSAVCALVAVVLTLSHGVFRDQPVSSSDERAVSEAATRTLKADSYLIRVTGIRAAGVGDEVLVYNAPDRQATDFPVGSPFPDTVVIGDCYYVKVGRGDKPYRASRLVRASGTLEATAPLKALNDIKEVARISGARSSYAFQVKRTPGHLLTVLGIDRGTVEVRAGFVRRLELTDEAATSSVSLVFQFRRIGDAPKVLAPKEHLVARRQRLPGLMPPSGCKGR